MRWWLSILPMQALDAVDAQITYRRQKTTVEAEPQAPDPGPEDRVMLVPESQEPHLLQAEILRFPHHAEPGYFA